MFGKTPGVGMTVGRVEVVEVVRVVEVVAGGGVAVSGGGVGVGVGVGVGSGVGRGVGSGPGTESTQPSPRQTTIVTGMNSLLSTEGRECQRRMWGE